MMSAFNWENSLCSLSKTTSLLLVTLERVEEQTTAVAELISSQTFQIEVFLVEFQVTWGISFVLIFSYIQNIAVKDTVVDYDYQKVSCQNSNKMRPFFTLFHHCALTTFLHRNASTMQPKPHTWMQETRHTKRRRKPSENSAICAEPSSSRMESELAENTKLAFSPVVFHCGSLCSFDTKRE